MSKLWDMTECPRLEKGVRKRSGDFQIRPPACTGNTRKSKMQKCTHIVDTPCVLKGIKKTHTPVKIHKKQRREDGPGARVLAPPKGWVCGRNTVWDAFLRSPFGRILTFKSILVFYILNK